MAVSMLGVGVMELFILMVVGSGIGIPLGIPPGPEDPMMLKVAPEKCLYYATWAGMATPDPKSSNQTEQLLAEPDLHRLLAEVEHVIDQMIESDFERQPDEAELVRKIPPLVKTLLRHPCAVYVESIAVGPDGPDLRGALIMNLGKDAEQVTEFLRLATSKLPPDALQQVQIGGATFQQLQLGRNAPTVVLGTRDKYFIAGVGTNSVEQLLQRAATPPPEWLTQQLSQSPVERRASFSNLNVPMVVDLVNETGGPQASAVVEALGLSALGNLTSISGLDETGVVCRTVLATKPGSPSALDWFSAKPLTAADLAPIPREATIAAVCRLNLSQVFDGVIQAATQIEPRAAGPLKQQLDQFGQALGMDVRNDLLATIGDVWTLHTAPSSGGLMAGWTLTVNIVDRDKFQRAHDQLLGFAKGLFMRERRAPRINSTNYNGHTIYSLVVPESGFMFTPSWCVTDDHLVVTLMPQPVMAFLGRAANAESLADQPDIAAALALKPAPVAVSFRDTRSLFETVYPWVQFAVQAGVNELARSDIQVDPTALPSMAAIGPHLRPSIGMLQCKEDGWYMTQSGTSAGASIGASTPILVAMLLPAFQMRTVAIGRAQSTNNLKQIALSMHNHHDVFKAFPAAYKADQNGKPLLSWRVAILPFIEQGALYDQFHFDEPWDSPHNKQLIAKMPDVYRSPQSKAAPGKTVYLGNASEKGIFVPPDGNQPNQKWPNGVRFRDIRDGTSNTIMVLEVDDSAAVEWTKPADFAPDKDDPLKHLGHIQRDSVLVAFCDGSVRTLPVMRLKESLLKLLTRDGGEVVDLFRR